MPRERRLRDGGGEIGRERGEGGRERKGAREN